MDETRPDAYFADLARRLIALNEVDDVMAAIVHASVEVTGCDHASLSHLHQKRLISASSNDEVGGVLDAIQTETQEGPCLDAIRTGEVVVVEDLANDVRYRSYGPRAVRSTTVRSSVGVPLVGSRAVIGALNLFSDRPAAFGDLVAGEEALVAILAAHAAPALSAALYRQNMEAALANRDLIGQAKGMLMARAHVSSDRAFELLVEASQRMNVKLTDVARRLVAGTLPINRDGLPIGIEPG